MTPPAAAATAHAGGRVRSTHRAVPVPAGRPRRQSGPARRPVAVPAPRARARTRPFDAAWLDRVMFGRAWIGLIAAALMGLVFLQVSLLKLNTGIGRAVTAEATLERQNALLRTEVAKLESGERIEAVAAKLGLVMPGADRVNYLTASPADGARAARSFRRPEPVAQQPAPLAPAGATATPTATTQPVASPVTPAPTPQAATQQPVTPVADSPAQTQAQTPVQPQAAAPPPQAATATATATGGAATP